MLTLILLILPLLSGLVMLLSGTSLAKTLALGTAFITLGIALFGLLAPGADRMMD